MNRFSETLLYRLTLALVAAVHVAGLPIPLMDPDAAVYATLAKTIAETGDYGNLYLVGRDWLDKPHFPFWVTALSFKLFGINTVAYKLPGLLFMAGAAAYTYRLARRLYTVGVARMAVLMLLTALHIIMSDADVRAEPFLTGLIAGSVYHFYRLKERFAWSHLLLGAAFAGGAMMTKGLFTLVPIGGAIGAELLLKRDWRGLFHPKWALAVLLSFVFTLPELLSLYAQFDAHPEKVVFGQTGVSGVKFFFWDSQFGRFFNTGPIKGEGDKFFFLHTLLWAFLPWALLMYAALFRLIRRNLPKLDPAQEWYTLGAALPTLLLFSLSSFQLPHYANIVFPFLAILTAAFVETIRTPAGRRAYAAAQGLHVVLLVVAVGLLHVFFQPPVVTPWFWLAVAAVLGVGVALAKAGLPPVPRIFYVTCLTAALFNFYVNLVFYPNVLPYQAAGPAARYASRHFPRCTTAVFGDIGNNSFEFYHRGPVTWYFQARDLDAARRRDSLLVYTTASQLDTLRAARIPYQMAATFPHFHVTTLTGEFVNHRTRPQALERHVLVVVPKAAGALRDSIGEKRPGRP
jgi:4-amino-4-deoxy-L-arabinose transferase-like glycosyltransferase